jgi:hypothetical protein
MPPTILSNNEDIADVAYLKSRLLIFSLTYFSHTILYMKTGSAPPFT